MADFVTALGFLIAAVGLLLVVVGVFVRGHRIWIPLMTLATGCTLLVTGLWFNGYRSVSRVVEVLQDGKLPRSIPLPDAEHLYSRLQSESVYSDSVELDLLAGDLARLLELRHIGDEYWPAMRLYETLHEDLGRQVGDFWPELPGSGQVVLQETWSRPPDLRALSAEELAAAWNARSEWESSRQDRPSGKAKSSVDEQRRIERSKAVLQGRTAGGAPMTRADSLSMTRWHALYSQSSLPTKRALSRVVSALRNPGEGAGLGDHCRELRRSVSDMPRSSLDAPDEGVRILLHDAYGSIEKLASTCLKGQSGLMHRQLEQTEKKLGAAAQALGPYSMRP